MGSRSDRERQIAYDIRLRWKLKWIEKHEPKKQKYPDIKKVNFWFTRPFR